MVHLLPARQGRTGNDLIFALNAEATQRAQRGEAIVNATLGTLMKDDGSLAVLDTVTQVLSQVPRGEWNAYAPIAGTPGFLEAVIADTLSTQPRLSAAAVAVATPGGTGALRHAVVNFLEPGQALLTPSLYWGPYQTLCDEHRRRVETFRMFDEGGRLDVAGLGQAMTEQLARQGRVLLFLNDPCNNPTGYSMTREEWRAVVATLLEHADRPVTLLVDMAYWLYGAVEPRDFLAELVPLLGRVGLLFAWSASKSFTSYGLRVGALVAVVDDESRPSTQAALSYSCRGTWSNCVRGGMWAMTRLLTDPVLRASADAERAELRGLLMRRVEAFNAAARPLGLRYPRYEGGFFVTVFHGEPEQTAERMRALGVYVVPQAEGVRIALCSVPEASVPRLVATLAASRAF